MQIDPLKRELQKEADGSLQLCSIESNAKCQGMPALKQSLQLQALRTELEAAEATVAELKRLISELEQA